MKTYTIIIILFLCIRGIGVQAQNIESEYLPLLGTWTFTDYETEKEDDCFTTYRFEFQSNNKCSHWNDIGVISTKKVTMRKLIFKGTFEYNSKQREIIIHIEGDENSSLKIKILTLTSTTLSLEDEGGNKMDLVKTIKRDCSGTKH